jgi:hypothetical protein
MCLLSHYKIIFHSSFVTLKQWNIAKPFPHHPLYAHGIFNPSADRIHSKFAEG